jgi:hypothetical protein
MRKVVCNSFVKRQTAESRFSHFDETWEELETLVETHLDKATPGYRDGVILVPVPPERFASGVVEVTPDTSLVATFKARSPGEEPFIDVVALRGLAGPAKLQAKHVDIVLYRHDVLDAEVTRDANGAPVATWEIISINARPTDEPEPMHPMAMARNFLGLPGGTQANHTAEEFARAVVYWSKRAMCGSVES